VIERELEPTLLKVVDPQQFGFILYSARIDKQQMALVHL
jgi:hypothetical protein